MSDHLEKDLLKRYGQHQLSPGEIILVADHLEQCEKCFEKFTQIFSHFNAAAVQFSQALSLKEESFHLDYDEHLQPYIDELVDEVDREIVESHLLNCSFCLQQVRELNEFKQSLELRSFKEQIANKQKETWLFRLVNFFQAHRRISTMAALFIFFSAIALLIFRFSFINQEMPGIQVFEVSSPDEANPHSNSDIVKSGVNVYPEDKAVQTNSGRENKGIKKDSLPIREKQKEEIQIAELNLPQYLKDLQKESSQLRSTQNNLTEKITVISPNKEVILQTTPILRWKGVSDSNQYQVSLFDENLNPLTNETLSGDAYKIPVILTRGKFYYWRVSTQIVEKSYLGQGKFYVLGNKERTKIDQAIDSLQRGKAFAEAGLLKEAQGELNRYLIKHPDSITAKKWLRQIKQIKAVK